ncbi:MAG: 4a-hydroxytetrahydrobiopterin dehydratase [Candidatus Methylacidiphilales bacterium]
MPNLLSETEVAIQLAGRPGWSSAGSSISRTYRFRNFVEAFAFMTACALEAEKLNHHPEWSNVWATVDVRLTTHDAGGLTELDFRLAERMDAVAATMGVAA